MTRRLLAAVGLGLVALGLAGLLVPTHGYVVTTDRATDVDVDDETVATSGAFVRVVPLDPAGTVTRTRTVAVLNLTDLTGEGYAARTVELAVDPTGELAVAASGFSDGGTEPGDVLATSGASQVEVVCDGTTANASSPIEVSVRVVVATDRTTVGFTRTVSGLSVDCTEG